MRLDNRSRIVDGKQSDRPLFRAWIIGLLLIPVNCYWIIQMEEVRRAAGATVFSLFFNSIFTLWVLFSFNQVRDRFKRKSDGTSSSFSLDTKELLTIYIMVNMVTALCSYGMLPILLPVVTCAFWGATPENEWRTLFHHDLPFWLTVTQPKALTDYYQGDASLYSRWNLEAWLIPLCWWSLFTFVLVVVMLCVDIIVCQQWVKREKLAYPIAEIPLNLVRPHFYNRLMWIGFAMAVTINLVNGLHMLFPQMPELTFLSVSTSVISLPISLGIHYAPCGLPLFLLSSGSVFSCRLIFSSHVVFSTSTGKDYEYWDLCWDGKPTQPTVDTPISCKNLLVLTWQF